MVKKSILFIVIALFLTGCNDLESYKEDALELWKNGAGTNILSEWLLF
ncbi:lipoprotein [Pontibacillus marinus]|nr:lipoprotein [Pontibacillus marinus]